jgi:hypothetical protein
MLATRHNLDAEDIEIVRAAFERVCDVLRLDGGTEDPVTGFVFTKVVELAKSGEHDPERLCISVLAGLNDPPQNANPT